MRGTWKALRRVLLIILGWILVAVGIAAIFLPGPGLLLLLAGLVVLSQEYEWAERRVDPMAAKAFEVAKQGVSTWPRIALSTLAALCVIAAGVFWWISPEIPEVGPIGPELPFGGWGTGLSMIISGFIAIGLLVYSVKRWRAEAKDAHRTARAERRATKAEQKSGPVSS
jgi:hypothetical protein